MAKGLVFLVFALIVVALAWESSVPLSAQAGGSGQKVIHDRTEYNAYMAALNTQDAAQKAAAMEAFVAQYPQSVVMINALEQAMAAYQQGGNAAKVEAIANRLLQLDPSNVRALAIVVALKRAKVTVTGDVSLAQEAATLARSGITLLPGWSRPEGITEPDFDKLRNQMVVIFNGAAGFGALQSKDYAAARKYYVQSIQLDPGNLQDVYQLSIALLEANPIDLNGFWYAAKAVNLAAAQNNQAGAQSINNYASAKYRGYHGSAEGWSQLVQSAAGQNAPPAPEILAKMIPPKPTLCDIAAEAVATHDIVDLSVSDYVFILAQRDAAPKCRAAADKVWQAIQDKQKGGAKLKLPAKVITASQDAMDLALADDNQTANQVDLHVIMEKPMLRPPSPGSKIDIIGVLTGYTANPFLFTMEKGELPAAPR